MADRPSCQNQQKCSSDPSGYTFAPSGLTRLTLVSNVARLYPGNDKVFLSLVVLGSSMALSLVVLGSVALSDFPQHSPLFMV